MRNARAVAVVQSIIALVAIIALVISLTAITQKNAANRKAIERAAYEGCKLDQRILLSFHTPQGKLAASLIFRHNPALKDCHHYATHLQ